MIIKDAIEKDNAKEVDKPLNGLPIAIKDLSDVQSWAVSMPELPGFQNHTTEYLASVVFVEVFLENSAMASRDCERVLYIAFENPGT